jgi:TolA-binding protein
MKYSDDDFLADASYWTAEAYFEQGLYIKALSAYQTVISDYPVSEYVSFAQYSQGWCYEKLGEYRMAIDTYRDVMKNFPMKEIAVKSQYKIAEILYKNFDNSRAKEELLIFIEKYPVNERIFDAYYMLGDVCYRMEQPREALLNLEKSLKGAASKQWKAAAEYKLAKLSYLNNDISGSDDWFRKASEDTTDDLLFASALFNRADIRAKSSPEGTEYFKNSDEEIESLYDAIIKRKVNANITSDAFYLLGNHYYKKGRFNKAVETFKRAFDCLPSDKTDAKLHYAYAWALMKLGDTPGALEEFFKVIDTADSDQLKASSLFSAAKIKKNNKTYPEAQILYDTILKDFPESSYADRAQYELGVIFKNNGSPDAAIMSFRAIEANFPESPLLYKTLFQLGDLYMAKGDHNLANIQYDRIINNLDDSRLKNEALLKKALLALNNGNFYKVIDICGQINSSDEGFKVRGDYYTALANYKLGRDKEALSIFARIKNSTGTENMIPLIDLWFGQYHYENGDFEKALSYFNDLITEYPGSAVANDASYWKGWVLYDSGYEQESLEHFRDLIRVFPGTDKAPRAMLAIGDIYLKKNEIKKAVNTFKDFIRNYSDNKLSNIAKEKIGTCLKLQQEYMRAIDYYEMALTGENSDMNTQIQFDIAECYDKTGRIQEAIEEYLKVEYKYPKNEYWVTRALYRCAELLEKEGETERARKLYKKLSGKTGKEAELARKKIKILQRYTR